MKALWHFLRLLQDTALLTLFNECLIVFNLWS